MPNPPRALQENCRVLRPGGQLYLHVFRAGAYYDYLYSYVGGPMRAVRRSGALGRLLVDRACFAIYRTSVRLLKPGQSRDPAHLRNLYENYLLKSMVTSLRREAIERVSAEMQMEVVTYAPKGPMHWYVARKRLA